MSKGTEGANMSDTNTDRHQRNHHTRLATLDIVDAVHAQLEHLTPPEALDVLRIVAANLKAEIADFNQSKRADGSP